MRALGCRAYFVRACASWAPSSASVRMYTRGARACVLRGACIAHTRRQAGAARGQRSRRQKLAATPLPPQAGQCPVDSCAFTHTQPAHWEGIPSSAGAGGGARKAQLARAPAPPQRGAPPKAERALSLSLKPPPTFQAGTPPPRRAPARWPGAPPQTQRGDQSAAAARGCVWVVGGWVGGRGVVCVCGGWGGQPGKPGKAWKRAGQGSKGRKNAHLGRSAARIIMIAVTAAASVPSSSTCLCGRVGGGGGCAGESGQGPLKLRRLPSRAPPPPPPHTHTLLSAPLTLAYTLCFTSDTWRSGMGAPLCLACAICVDGREGGRGKTARVFQWGKSPSQFSGGGAPRSRGVGGQGRPSSPSHPPIARGAVALRPPTRNPHSRLPHLRQVAAPERRGDAQRLQRAVEAQLEFHLEPACRGGGGRVGWGRGGGATRVCACERSGAGAAQQGQHGKGGEGALARLGR